MNDAPKPTPEVCGNCLHYIVDPGNVKQGICHRYPPNAQAIPQPATVQRPQATLMVMLIPTTVSHDYPSCGEWEPVEPEASGAGG